MTWALVVGAGVGLVGAGVSYAGSQKAAKTAAKGSDAASAEAARQFDLTRSDTAPYRAIGNQAINALGSIYGYQPSSSYYGPGAPSDTPYNAPQMGAPNINDSLLGKSATNLFNPGGSAIELLGAKPNSTLGKIVDPIGGFLGKAFSGHGDERRNLSAFTSQNQLYDMGNGMVSLADGTIFPKSQIQQVAGAWYGANYAPDGNQADWQSKYAGLVQKPAANIGQAGTGNTSDGVNQGFSANQGMSPTGQPSNPAGTPGTPNYGAFFQSPDYQFRQSQGLTNIGNSFSASGGAKSGNALKALADFNSNLAAGGFNDYFKNQLALTGVGTGATNTSANAGIATGQIVGNALQNAGNARASGIAGGYNAIGAGLSGVGQGLGYYLQQRQQNPYGANSGMGVNSPYNYSFPG